MQPFDTTRVSEYGTTCIDDYLRNDAGPYGYYGVMDDDGNKNGDFRWYVNWVKGETADIEWMSPAEYLLRCDRENRRGTERTLEIAERMRAGEVFGMPWYSADDGTYYLGSTQEGAHRAAAAEMLGVDLIPVVVVRDFPRGAHIAHVTSATTSDESSWVTDGELRAYELYATPHSDECVFAGYVMPDGHDWGCVVYDDGDTPLASARFGSLADAKVYVESLAPQNEGMGYAAGCTIERGIAGMNGSRRHGSFDDVQIVKDSEDADGTAYYHFVRAGRWIPDVFASVGPFGNGWSWLVVDSANHRSLGKGVAHTPLDATDACIEAFEGSDRSREAALEPMAFDYMGWDGDSESWLSDDSGYSIVVSWDAAEPCFELYRESDGTCIDSYEFDEFDDDSQERAWKDATVGATADALEQAGGFAFRRDYWGRPVTEGRRVAVSDDGEGSFALDPRIPDDVDSQKNNQKCPFCGSDSFDGKRCSVCGYEEPPEGLGDINIDDDDDEDEGEGEGDEGDE